MGRETSSAERYTKGRSLQVSGLTFWLSPLANTNDSQTRRAFKADKVEVWIPHGGDPVSDNFKTNNKEGRTGIPVEHLVGTLWCGPIALERVLVAAAAVSIRKCTD